ncbi:MAG: glutathione-dependent disulfide-bond oxidoreductase [Gammaproteobacteria bacterium]|nr:glutathione-dependent disulfide-bond oxidoreductase [Gammaproteobacteria bacterium]
MSDPYVPPKVWKWDEGDEGSDRFSPINRPVAGSTHEKELPVGKHPIQIYSQGTPNGVKVTIMLEELLGAGVEDAEYDAWLVRINGEQFSTGFVKVNPNSKIPAMLDMTTSPPTRVFETGAILLYLAEKFEHFVPKDGLGRAECLSWLFWQMGSAPYLGGGFGHFYFYTEEKYEYPINRYAMEIKRQMDVLDRNLADRRFLIGDEYTIADVATYSWYGQMVVGNFWKSREFLDIDSYTNVIRWATEIHHRPAVRRGRKVNRTSDTGITERHDASDFDKFGL